MTIVDSHVHYWEPARPDRPWDPKGTDIGPPWSVEELLTAAGAAGVDQIVEVVPTMMGYDNRYGLDGAERFPDRVAGVFGRFDPSQSNLAQRIDEFVQHPKMIGMRLTLMKPELQAWIDDGTLDALLRETARVALPVAILAPRRAQSLGKLASRNPGALVLVDHMAMSHSDPEPFALWHDVLELERVPNVYVKVTYFPEVAHEAFPFPGVRRYAKELVETFGADRLIWGSNFPPSQRACSYEDTVRHFKELDVISESDKARIFGATFLDLIARTQERRRGVLR